jgi:DNA repair exonuclease SbcCD nuclease subunit
MVKKIIQISDIHIRTFKRHDEYNEQFEKFYQMAAEEKPDRIVITGDIVHQKIQMSPELVDMVQNFLTKCSNIAKTIVLIGNHDFLTNNMERLDALTPVINTMNNPNIMYFKRSECVEDDNIVWVPISLMDENKVPESFDPKNKDKDKIYIGLYHSPLTGIKTDLGFEFGEVYSLDNFNGLDWVLAGDIHKRQVIKESNPTIIMVGSMIQQNFGETLSSHGYCSINLETNKFNFVDIPNDYGYYQFKLKSIDDLDTGSEDLLNG